MSHPIGGGGRNHRKEWAFLTGKACKLNGYLVELENVENHWRKAFMAGEAKDVKRAWKECECTAEATSFTRDYDARLKLMQAESKKLLCHQRVEADFSST